MSHSQNKTNLTLQMTDGLMDHLKLVLSGKKILLGVTGSIAAFKAQDLVRILRDCGALVQVALTKNAQEFVTPLTMETLSGRKVIDSLWQSQLGTDAFGTHHIDQARWADLLLIAPATANIIAKLAHGVADDYLSTESLAFSGPLVVAPAMNPIMWKNGAVQENAQKLRSRGVSILGPIVGETACGEMGEGRMLEPVQLICELAQIMAAAYPNQSNQSLSQKTVLLTMGPTRSWMDPVRYLTNRSSGKMGAALAWNAVFAGANVIIVTGPTDEVLPLKARIVRVETAREMLSAVEELWSVSDVYIGAAAVLDFEFQSTAEQKLKKADALGSSLEGLKVHASKDILSVVSLKREAHQRVFGFAAETHEHLSSAYEKVLKKGCDGIFVNDVSKSDRGFESRFNAGVLIFNDGKQVEIAHQTKAETARDLLELISTTLPGSPNTRSAHVSV